MSHGKHRATGPKKTTVIRRIAAGLSLAAAAATTGLLTDELAATPQDTTWGAPDTVAATVDDGTVATPQDTTWG